MFRRSAVCSLFLVIVSGSVHATCSDYASPTRMLKSDYLATDFGTIAIPRPGVPTQVLAFENSSCYDLSNLSLQSLKVRLNNRDANEKPSFMAANVIRTYDYDMAGEPQYQVKFRRNANTTDSPAKWVRAKGEEKLQEGDSFNGKDSIVLDGEFELKDNRQFGKLDEFLAVKALSGQELADWHALIVPLDDSSSDRLVRNRSYTVVENTRDGIDPVSMDGIDLSAAPQSTVISQLQLIKFQRLATSNQPVPVLDINVRSVSCLYLRYRVDGSSDANFEPGNAPRDYLVLRLNDGVSC